MNGNISIFWDYLDRCLAIYRKVSTCNRLLILRTSKSDGYTSTDWCWRAEISLFRAGKPTNLCSSRRFVWVLRDWNWKLKLWNNNFLLRQVLAFSYLWTGGERNKTNVCPWWDDTLIYSLLRPCCSFITCGGICLSHKFRESKKISFRATVTFTKQNKTENICALPVSTNSP